MSQLPKVLYLNQDSDWVQIEEAYREYIGLDILKTEIPKITQELRSITPYPGDVDLDNFRQQYMQAVEVIDRVSWVEYEYGTHKKKMKKAFDWMLAKRSECSDINGKTKEDKKRNAELELIRYVILLDSLEDIVSMALVLKMTYQRRQDSISRMLSYVEYKGRRGATDL